MPACSFGKGKSKTKAAESAEGGPPAKADAKPKASAALAEGGPPAKAEAKTKAKAAPADGGPPAKADAKTKATPAEGGPPAKAEAKTKTKASSAPAEGGPPANAYAKAEAKAAARLDMFADGGPPPPAKSTPAKSAPAVAEAKATAAPADGGPPAKSKAAATTATAATEPFVLKAPDVGLRPTCFRCKQEVDPLRAVLTSKAKGSWKCPKCNVRGTQLHRIFGRWPPANFATLSQNAQADFWKKAGEASNTAQLEDILVQTLTTQRIEREKTVVGGEYLPLSVYKQRGFDPERIKLMCKDTEEHDVLGTTYKLNIRAVFSEAIEQQVREEVAKMKENKLKRENETASGAGELDSSAAPAAASSGEAKKKRKRSSSSASTTSSSSASSSTSTGKKKTSKKNAKKATKKEKKNDPKEKKEKKDGKEPKDKKDAALRVQQELEKEAARQQVANVKQATKILAKVQPQCFALKRDLDDPMVKHVADFAKGPAKKYYAELQKMQQAAETVISNRGSGAMPAILDMKKVVDVSKDAQMSATLFAKMLATARSHAT